MRNLRYYFRLVLAFIGKFKGLLLIGVLFGILSFFIVNIISPYIFQRTKEIIGITGRYHTENLPPFILSLVGDGLTKIDEDGTVIPNLASSWESPDKGKTWRFTLKDNVLWQDGEKVTSDTIIYEFTDVEIERPDDKTIIFKLKDPFVPFPSVVSRPTFRKGLLGTNKWKVDKISISGSFIQELVITEERNKKIYKFYPTEERTKLAFKLGEVDIIKEISTPSPLDSWDTLYLSEDVNAKRIVTVFFNNNDKLLSEKSLRQALIYAIDKNSLGGNRAISPISSQSWAFNPLVKKYEYDKERAKELIDELPDEIKDDINIKLISNPVLLKNAESIAKQWEEIGIKTSVLVASTIPSEFQAYLTILDVPDDPDQYSFWHSTQEVANISNYFSPRIDKLLEDGRTELAFEERRKIYLDFQRFLVEDSPAAFLYQSPTYTISRK